MQIINKIKEEVKIECDKYKRKSEDCYDFLNEHVKYVYKEANF